MTQTVEDAVTTLSIRSQAFVDGAYVDAASGETFDCVSPGTGRVIAQVAACDAEDVDRAVAGARRAFESGVWSRTAPKKRKKAVKFNFPGFALSPFTVRLPKADV